MVFHALLENPLQWSPLLNLAYYRDEQKQAVRDVCHVIQSYCDNEQLCYKPRVYSGFPGSGKTTVAKHATYYAASQNLNIIVTTLANERAQLLGGQHIHDVFCMPVSKSTRVPAMVANSLDELHKIPTKLIFLQQLDFINFDEIGLISACYVATKDAILQHVKSNNNPFVGVIVVASGDPNQCPPPSGEPLWTSSRKLTVDVPYHCNSSDKFFAFGWRWLTLSKQISFNHHFMGTTCHRTQFPVRNFIVMTVHKCMGGGGTNEASNQDISRRFRILFVGRWSTIRAV